MYLVYFLGAYIAIVLEANRLGVGGLVSPPVALTRLKIQERYSFCISGQLSQLQFSAFLKPLKAGNVIPHMGREPCNRAAQRLMRGGFSLAGIAKALCCLCLGEVVQWLVQITDLSHLLRVALVAD